MTKNSSSSRARKLALNSGTTRRSAKNGHKGQKNPLIAVTHAESVSVSVATGMSADSGDELNLRHPIARHRRCIITGTSTPCR